MTADIILLVMFGLLFSGHRSICPATISLKDRLKLLAFQAIVKNGML